MNNLKQEFVNAIMMSLKIQDNPFIVATVSEYIEDVQPINYKGFMKELFGTQHQYLNGLDRIAKVAERFKPQKKDNSLELKAKELISWCGSANNVIFDNAKKSGRTFADEIKGTTFTALSDTDLAILNQVKPHHDHKLLIAKINTYTTSLTQLQVFKNAIAFAPSDAIQIANPLDRLQIKKG